MADNSRRRNTVIIIIIVALLLLLALLLTRCLPKKTTTLPQSDGPTPPAATQSAIANPPPASMPASSQPDEILTPATVTAPPRVTAGAVFPVTWTGPDNHGDFVTIVRPDAVATDFRDYRETDKGKSLELTAPIEPGAYEVRYVANRSHTILGRAPVEVVPAGVTLDAVAEVVLGSEFPVTWTGPDNHGDYIAIVPRETPDGQFGNNFTYTEKGSPLTVIAPTVTGDAELRYMTGQGNMVLARRVIRIIAAEITLAAPADAIAGTTIAVTWTGPNNAGDYITAVAKEIPDGQYGNYTYTTTGSPLNLLLPIMAGDAELRYMTGQGNKVLGRRAIKINAAVVTLAAPTEASANADVSITWTGPNNPGDFISIVTKATPDGQYAAYTYATEGSPLIVKAPKDAGDAEIRYMTGQGYKVLARIPIKVNP